MDIFHFIMEAPEDEEIASFDATGEDETSPPIDASGEAQSPGAEEQPPTADGDEDIQSFDDGGDDYGDAQQDEGDPDSEENPDKKDTKLSEKVNNILNQKLYTQLLNKNAEVADIIEGYQTIIPSLSSETIKKNDGAIKRLKAALSNGQSYAIEKFVGSKYGENQMFVQKLNVLYTMLLDEINKNLKDSSN